MFKSLLLAGVAAILCAVAGAAPAKATVLDFTLTIADPNSDTASWSQSDSPTPADYGGTGTDITVSNPLSSFGSFSDVNFNDSQQRGGIRIFTPDDSTLLLRATGPIIYSGSVSAPTFAPGVFDLTTNTLAVVESGYSAVLTITAAAVPEPATWAMMLVGLGVVGSVVRRRQNVRVAYA